MRAVRFHRTGDADVLRVDDIEAPEPGPGEILVRLRAIGVNFIDVYLRRGSYDPGPLPAIAGKEGAGEVMALGEGVDQPAVGERVAFFDAPGAYAEQVVIRAERALPIPAALGWPVAAALPLQGLTAHYLTHTIAPLKAGQRVLIHAAAGGVGHLAVQMAVLAGAEVFGTCSTADKAARVSALGARHVIRYDETDFVAAVLDETDDAGVDLAIDGVGRATFEGSVRATRVRGHVILFGQASGEPDPIRPRALLGSRTLTTASLFAYTRTRAELLEHARPVLEWAAEGRLVPMIDRVLPLAEAACAHALLEGRRTQGKVILDPTGDLAG